jgi:hypothetical protein
MPAMPKAPPKQFDPLRQGFRLHARTTVDIDQKVGAFLKRLARSGLIFRDRKPKLEPLINVLVLEFLKLDEADQLALMLKEIPRFEDLLLAEATRREQGEDITDQLIEANPVPKPKRRKSS